MTDINISANLGVGGEPQILPPGVHPQDQRGPGFNPVPPDRGPTWHPGRQPFDTEPAHALPVCERAALSWSARTINLSSSSNPLRAAQKVVGRKAVTLWVDDDEPAGCILSPTRDMVDDSYGVRLVPGGSVTIRTEAPVWVAMDTSQTAVTVYVIEEINPATPVPGT